MTAIVETATAKAHLNLTDSNDDGLIETYVAAAQSWLESQLGYSITERYPSNVPPALTQGVLLMTGHYYANREGSIVGTSAGELPLGVCDIVNDYRDWSWADDD